MEKVSNFPKATWLSGHTDSNSARLVPESMVNYILILYILI